MTLLKSTHLRCRMCGHDLLRSEFDELPNGTLDRYCRSCRVDHRRNPRRAIPLTHPAPNPSGLCMCGCGERTEIADRTRPSGDVAGTPRRFRPGHHLRKSLAEYIEEDRGYTTPCWIWQRTMGKRSGYGRAWDGERMIHAHQLIYKRHKGAIPEGMELDHLCRVRLCVNPDHLEPVTHLVNCRRGAKTKLTDEMVAEIRALALTTKPSEIARRFGVSHQHVNALIRRAHRP